MPCSLFDLARWPSLVIVWPAMRSLHRSYPSGWALRWLEYAEWPLTAYICPPEGKEELASHHEPKKRAEARPEAELVPAEGEQPTGRVPDPFADRVAEFLRLVRAEPAGRDPEVPHESGDYVHDAHGVPQMHSVCDDNGGGPSLP
ncbi:hypothetical protein ACS0TY_016616 [Phlomoides rotata]